jgi:predicted nucleic acid-binding protein
MAQEADTVVVVTDANVIINLFHIGQLPLFGALHPYRFRVPAEVVAEILDPTQQAAVTACIEAGHLEEVVVDTVDALSLFADLRDVMGRGEAACLALAKTGGFHIASDEKKRFRRRAIELIGESRILRTESLLLEAIRRKQISVQDADGYKAILAANSYALSFNSFADLL